MKKILLLLTAVAIWFLPGSDALAAPQLTISNPKFDFGYVPQKTRISHVFTLHSTGDDTVKILKVIPGCGCTRAPLKKDVLAPGDSTSLEIIFDTRTYRKRVAKSPRLMTNEPDPYKNVSFEAWVINEGEETPPLIFDPVVVNVLQFGDTTRDQATFTIENVSDLDVELTLISRSKDYFELTLPKKVKAGEMVEGKVKVPYEYLGSGWEKSFTVEANDMKKTRYTIPVKRSFSGKGQMGQEQTESKETAAQETGGK